MPKSESGSALQLLAEITGHIKNMHGDIAAENGATLSRRKLIFQRKIAACKNDITAENCATLS